MKLTKTLLKQIIQEKMKDLVTEARRNKWRFGGGDKVRHKEYGLGRVNGRVPDNKKGGMKTYNVAFSDFDRDVIEHNLEPA